MKIRVASSIFGLLILAVMLFQFKTIFVSFVLSFFGTLMCYEIFCVTHINEKSLTTMFISLIFSICFQFLKINEQLNFKFFAIVLYAVVVVLIALKKHKTIKFETISFCCGFNVLIQLCLNILLIYRDIFKDRSIYYVFLVCLIPWACDTGAYFIGLKFGRNKFAAEISPKKTVEGVIGGILTSCASVIIYDLICAHFFAYRINVFVSIVVMLVGSFAAVIGDLIGSLIKRQFKTKDFGFIFFGHGGILDRFDSWLFSNFVLFPILTSFQIIS